MRAIDAMQEAQNATRKELSPLEKGWLDRTVTAVGEMARRGMLEGEVRFLAPPDMGAADLLSTGRRLAVALESDGFRARPRLRDDFLQEGPAWAGDWCFDQGRSLLWLELSLDWDR